MDLLDEQLKVGLEGNFERGWEICKQLEEERPNCNRSAFNRGWYLMMRGDLHNGFELMNRGRWEEIWGNSHIGTSKPIYDGRDLNGEHILFTMEAGFGDEMVYVRFAKELSERGGRVTIACSDGLKSMFSRIPYTSAVVDYKAALAMYHDYWAPSMSTPYILGTTYETLVGETYLSASQEAIDKFKLVVNSKDLKVGVRWSGNPIFEHEQFRLFSEKLMYDAVNVDGVQAYSLQKDWDKGYPEHIIPLDKYLNDWEDTAGAIGNMDLVISSCTAVAHLAAAMGKPTWIVVPILPYYTWALPTNDSPWYDSVRLYRQEKINDWEPSFEKVYKDLKEKINV